MILKLLMNKTLEISVGFNRGAASVVDYLLVENPIQQKVENLKILLPEFDSKHTPITSTFRSKTIINSIGKLLNPPKAYK